MKRLLNPRTLTLILLVLITAGIATLLSACGGSVDGETSEPAEAVEAEPTADRYVIRGILEELPDPDDPMSAFYVEHEAVDNFKNMEGEVVGMDSMTMPFSVADDLPLEGLKPGDTVEFVLVVDWNGDPAIEVTEIRKLEPAPDLVFRQAAVTPG